jgi:hypothetical protein
MKGHCRKVPMSKAPEGFLVPLEGLKLLEKPRCHKTLIFTVPRIAL